MSVDARRERFPVVGGAPVRLGEPYPFAAHPVATRWCLHLRVNSRFVLPVQTLADRLLATGAEILTGDYIGGDSWAKWTEPYSDERALLLAEPGRALHAYFIAPDPEAAKRAGFYLALTVGVEDSRDAAVTAASDWSEELCLN